MTLPALPSWPESTYRLQFHKRFTFRDATAVVPYLHEFGVTHVYCSPYMKARAGSTHGYDVIDPNALNPELGTPEDYDAFVAALAARGMSQVLDVVPNHVGVGTNDNAWWNDVLEFGPDSKYAVNFDVEWDPPYPELKGKVLLPVLGKPPADVIAAGDLRVVSEDGRPWVRYYDRRFPINPGTRDLIGGPIEKLLDAQFYRLDDWRTAGTRINYRRFFDINDLAALAMERPPVFGCAHELTMKLVGEGKVTGLRIDHPDGLYDPKAYFERLQAAAQWRPPYVVAEKILEADEELPADWAVSGTTGYDFLAKVNGLYVPADAEDAMTRLYREFTGETTGYADLVYAKKLLVLEKSLGSELEMLAHRLERLARRSGKSFGLGELRGALAAVIAAFPVYRTYVSAEDGVSETDRRHVATALEQARRRYPGAGDAIYAFIRETLELTAGNPDLYADRVRFAAKFQQLTAPVTAKGVEDTAFYVYNRLISLNEVGGDPTHFGTPVEALHRYFVERQRRWPYAMSALSTHDTKRSEDVRARINVLAEVPDEWRSHVQRWRDVNRGYKTDVNGRAAPDANEEYLLYQTLVGAWPAGAKAADEAFVSRIQAYVDKALREAKMHSSWTDPNVAYDEAAKAFVGNVLKDQAFLEDFVPFAAKVADVGSVNSLSQTVLKLTAPGVPDTYQGTELLDFSLVDPDNRRAVDYGLRERLLAELAAGRARADFAGELMTRRNDGRVKLFVATTLLRLRREWRGVFSAGEYVPAVAAGRWAESVFAFLRRHEGRAALTAVPRLTTRVGNGWGDTRVRFPGAAGRFRNVLTGERVDVDGGAVDARRLFGRMPVAVLVST